VRPILSSLLLLAIAAFVVFAQDRSKLSDDEGKILALESVWNRAEQSKDIVALSHIFATNMVYVDYDGTIRTREQFLEYIKNDTSAPDQLVTEDKIVHSYKDCAVVTGVFRGKWSKAGKAAALRGRFTDTWVKMNDQWQVVASQATLVQK
jgi:ketosteroid isomerase-like protein